MKILFKKRLLYFLCFTLVFCISSISVYANDLNKGVSNKRSSSIKWIGHASFEITNKSGTKIITDPFTSDMGYTLPELKADIVTVSHGDFDHSNLQAVTSNFFAIRERGEFFQNFIKIKGIQTYHDNEKGAIYGENTVYTYNIDGVNVCHLGDLGHVLSPQDLKNIGEVDVLLIPVGGIFTLELDSAIEVINQLSPEVVIPMHYQTAALNDWGLNKIDAFTDKMDGWEIESTDIFQFNKAEISKTKNKIILLSY